MADTVHTNIKKVEFRRTPSDPELKTVSFGGWVESTNKLIDNINSLVFGDYSKTGTLKVDTDTVGINVDELYVNGNIMTKMVQFNDGSSMESSGVTRVYADTHLNDRSNPHGVTKFNIGMDKVDNVAFKDKPVSNATQVSLTALREDIAAMMKFDSEVKPDGELPVKAGGIMDFIAQSPTISPLNLKNRLYPVGTVYQTFTNGNPSSLLGFGTWSLIDSAVVLVSAGTNYPAKSTGGSYTQSLTVNNIPPHSHTVSLNDTGSHAHTRGALNFTGAFTGRWLGHNSGGTWTDAFKSTTAATGSEGATHEDGTAVRVNFEAGLAWSGALSWSGDHSHTVTLNSTGSGSAFSIMQPYVIAYMWRRTA